VLSKRQHPTLNRKQRRNPKAYYASLQPTLKGGVSWLMTALLVSAGFIQAAPVYHAPSAPAVPSFTAIGRSAMSVVKSAWKRLFR
jgi:hypothetical protein